MGDSELVFDLLNRGVPWPIARDAVEAAGPARRTYAEASADLQARLAEVAREEVERAAREERAYLARRAAASRPPPTGRSVSSCGRALARLGCYLGNYERAYVQVARGNTRRPREGKKGL